MLLGLMEMMEKNTFNGVLVWLNLTKLVFPGLCVKNQMLHPQWYIILSIIFFKKKIYIVFLFFSFLIYLHFFFFYRLILVMAGIVINSPLTIPIVLKCGLRIGLAGILFIFYFYSFPKFC
jgi:hypothetical protein